MKFRQGFWAEPLLKELSRKGRVGYLPPLDPKIKKSVGPPSSYIPRELRREEDGDDDLNLPEVSELQVLRHYNRLSQMNYSVELGMYPLGSCTMKYNPKVSELIASSDGMRHAHPLQPEETVQGLLSVLHELGEMLSEITGMHRFSLSTAAGALGGLAGVLLMRDDMRERQLTEKDEILVPDSAHGTNPASAAMGGFKGVNVPSGGSGVGRARV